MATFVAKMKIRIYDFVFLVGECELGILWWKVWIVRVAIGDGAQRYQRLAD